MRVLRKRVWVLLFFIIMALPLYSKSIFDYQRLNDGWELYLECTPGQINENTPVDKIASLPDIWNDVVLEKTGKNIPTTFGTYRYVVKNLDTNTRYALLLKDQPPTQCSLYINRELITENGTKNHKGIAPVYGEFYPDENGCVEILIYINNEFYRKGGLWDFVLFGKAQSLAYLNTIILMFYTIIAGLMFFVGLLNIIQFFVARKGKEYLYLGFVSIVFSSRVLIADYCALGILFPGFDFNMKIRLEYLVLWTIPIFVYLMLMELYSIGTRQRFLRYAKIGEYSIVIPGLILGVASLIVPPYVATNIVPVLQIYLLYSSVVILFSIVVCFIKKRKYINFYLISICALVVGEIIDLIYSKNVGPIPFSIFPLFMLIFTMVQVVLLAVIQNRATKEAIRISGDLQKLNQAYLRFVPQEFLNLLNKDSITNINLGDCSTIEMNILFAKINIDCDKENESSNEHFKIFNQCLLQISPIIKKHKGFVSKFLSGGFMALFDSSSLDTIEAAIEIKNCIDFVQKQLTHHKINVRIGIHYGKMIIGTIGEESRMDDTVISDTVNTCSRIKNVSEDLNKSIVVSKNVIDRLNPGEMDYIVLRQLNAIKVKGKEAPLELFECVVNDYKEQ